LKLEVTVVTSLTVTRDNTLNLSFCTIAASAYNSTAEACLMVMVKYTVYRSNSLETAAT